MNRSLESIPDPELLERTHSLVRRRCAVEAELFRYLGEVDARQLYLEEACPGSTLFGSDPISEQYDSVDGLVPPTAFVQGNPDVAEALWNDCLEQFPAEEVVVFGATEFFTERRQP